MSKKFVFKDYKQLLYFISSGLPQSRFKTMFDGEDKLALTRRFFSSIDNPQDKIKSIHIAGTSGKGTIAYLIESILRAAGKSTGLLVSPHVYDLRERAQINGKIASKKDYLEAANAILPGLVDRYIAGEQQTIFKFNTGLAFKLFMLKSVDYSVIEVGLGGTYDSTNAIHRKDKICVLGRIGKDHMDKLGKTYKEIAGQKAGIIQPHNQVIALQQNNAINSTFRERATAMNSEIQFINPIATRLKEEFGIKRWYELNRQLVGEFQNENVQLAVAAARAVSIRDKWLLSLEHVKEGIKKLQIPGRFEELNVGARTIIFDGAHNTQKAEGLVLALEEFFPGQKWCIIVAMRNDKQTTGLIRALGPLADSFIVTGFCAPDQDIKGESLPPQVLARKVRRCFDGKVYITDTADEAVELALHQSSPLLVTGSFYLLKYVKQAVSELS